LNISYTNKLIAKAYNKKNSWNIHKQSTLSLKIHSEQITDKLSTAFYAMR